MKQLALDRQTFEKLRNGQCLYVDKTKDIHRMVTEGRVYRLSRPRRFGKSLLVSTLEALFKGKKDLFEGLYIYDKWDWEQQYPVIKIDWAGINYSTPEKMEEDLILYLNEIAQGYRITLEAKSAVNCLRKLIRALREKTGKDVVVLIDEYDKPIAAHLTDPDLKEFQADLDNFYQVIKSSDKYLQFVFLTGVSNFWGLGFNSPQDITLSKKYAAICGYTREELESNFSEHIDSAAEYLKMTRERLLEQIRCWYSGYTWDGKTAVYNPFSTMSFFEKREFDNYWFNTGTPTFLINLVQRRSITLNSVLNPIVAGSDMFTAYEPSRIREVPLLFQTGYLTILQKKLTPDGVAEYTLGIPNREVTDSLLKHLLKACGKNPNDQEFDEMKRTIQR